MSLASAVYCDANPNHQDLHIWYVYINSKVKDTCSVSNEDPEIYHEDPEIYQEDDFIYIKKSYDQ